MSGLFVAALLVALAAAGTLGGFLWLDRRERRRQWARYDAPRGAGSFQPVLCPHCRQRSYSQRAIRERTCPNCGKGY